MKVGKKYKSQASGSVYTFIGEYKGDPVMVSDKKPISPFVSEYSIGWDEVAPEKWLSLWWTDKHKTNVSTSSAFYDSEAEADGVGRFTASDLYIKSVRVA